MGKSIPGLDVFARVECSLPPKHRQRRGQGAVGRAGGSALRPRSRSSWGHMRLGVSSWSCVRLPGHMAFPLQLLWLGSSDPCDPGGCCQSLSWSGLSFVCPRTLEW